MQELTTKYVNPTMDWSFKYLFGREAVKDILIGFLNAIIQEERPITDVTFLNNEHARSHKDGKTIIYDLLCETDGGEQIIVEMQNRNQGNFKDRALFYTARAIAEQCEKGDSEYNIKAVYGIFFLDFEMERPENKDPQQSRTEVALVDLETGAVFNPKLKQFFIELPRFNKTKEQCQTYYDRLIYTLKHMETMEAIPFMDREAIFARLDKVASVAQMSKEDRIEYNAELKTYRDYFNQMDYAKKTSRAEGHAEGRAEGRAEGIEEGLAKGQRLMQLQVARSMKQMGLSAEQVSQATGLTVAEVEAM